MRLTYLKNVTTLEYNIEKCTGCKMCTFVCPHGVFEMKDKKASITNKDLCMECGACAKNCASGAIKVHAGVGCATAIIWGKLRGTEPSCGGDDGSTGCGCGSSSDGGCCG
ncbi:MAG: 4Fe-4S dicluster domain-containing protein [Spirochaetaceae bacterium]|nr:MAG: 4Fe-4S dicluster domain-containing protein [Spirochaetaceae bacterium]